MVHFKIHKLQWPFWLHKKTSEQSRESLSKTGNNSRCSMGHHSSTTDSGGHPLSRESLPRDRRLRRLAGRLGFPGCESLDCLDVIIYIYICVYISNTSHNIPYFAIAQNLLNIPYNRICELLQVGCRPSQMATAATPCGARGRCSRWSARWAAAPLRTVYEIVVGAL